MNGGTCNEVRDGYECICPNGYKGSDCEGKHYVTLNYISLLNSILHYVAL